MDSDLFATEDASRHVHEQVLRSVREISDAGRVDAALAQHERRRSQSQRLESLGQLAGGIVHDFNNLLMVITFSVDFLRDAIAALDVPEAVRADLTSNLDHIDNAATSSATLTSQLLSFSRSEPMRIESLDLNERVSHIEALLRPSIEESVELVVDLTPGLPPVAADRGRFDQLVVNLVVNARDALPDGGRVRIATSLVDDTDRVRVEIADNGTGMSAEVRGRAFDPFFTTKGAGRGTGLGLATVYSIVTDLGGTIAIDSTLGVGTRVIVCLPIADSAPHSAPITTARRGHGERVLLAEDHDDVRTSFAAMLRRSGYTVVAVSSGEAALDASGATEFDLLITDIVIPGMSGRRLAERLRTVSPGLPVMYLSGHARHLVDATEDEHGRAVTIAKPVARVQLLRHVRALLDTRPGIVSDTRVRTAP